jgi:hypothetical protein
VGQKFGGYQEGRIYMGDSDLGLNIEYLRIFLHTFLGAKAFRDLVTQKFQIAHFAKLVIS